MIIRQEPDAVRAMHVLVRESMNSTQYQIAQWRKRLERKGWRNAKRFPPPQHEWIEYHAVWQGRIYSGRCKLSECRPDDWWQPGTHVYLIHRMHDVQEAVWRRASRELAGQVVWQ